MDEKEMPIYVRIEEYRDVLDVVNMLKNKLEEAKSVLAKLNELKNEEDIELERWENGLAAVERKIQFIDKTLFEPEAV
ncbi:hypothetical protein KY325_04235 [Candidatus Woesearchaeota archaeon]|nr:hypothetical protein [Candidatus Woesearchaeota archaeon]MBW3018344.1 hypothetical protein [Candidatus Woesearchaeota archaeon]